MRGAAISTHATWALVVLAMTIFACRAVTFPPFVRSKYSLRHRQSTEAPTMDNNNNTNTNNIPISQQSTEAVTGTTSYTSAAVATSTERHDSFFPTATVQEFHKLLPGLGRTALPFHSTTYHSKGVKFDTTTDQRPHMPTDTTQSPIQSATNSIYQFLKTGSDMTTKDVTKQAIFDSTTYPGSRTPLARTTDHASSSSDITTPGQRKMKNFMPADYEYYDNGEAQEFNNI